jgi:toxin ParE1/3/4
MPKVIRSLEAAEDLLEIWQYIADDNEAAADKFLNEINATSKMLARNPKAGRERPELALKLRSFPVGHYVLFYRPIDDGVEIVRVLHGARDVYARFTE